MRQATLGTVGRVEITPRLMVTPEKLDLLALVGVAVVAGVEIEGLRRTTTTPAAVVVALDCLGKAATVSLAQQAVVVVVVGQVEQAEGVRQMTS